MNKLHSKLKSIQTQIKCSKTRKNKFANYTYRTIDDIVEALKPQLEKHKCSFHFIEHIIFNDQMPIIKVEARLSDCESDSFISTFGIAGVDLNQKGMQTPQQFGSAGTYARKYAAGNLFLLDDSIDADTQDNTDKKPLLNKSHKKFQGYVEWLHNGKDQQKDLDKLKWLSKNWQIESIVFDQLNSIVNDKYKS